MKLRNILFFLSIFIGIALNTSAQECDTIIESKDTSQVYFFFHNVDSLALGRLHSYRMNLNGIHNYEEIYKETPFFASLGNPGLAYKNLLFDPKGISGFNFGIRSFDAYLLSNRETEYYVLTEPFSELIYMLGPKKEQMIQAKLHTKIFPRVTLGADFRYIFAPGKYQRQKSDNKSLALTLQYYTKNRRYGVIGSYRYNKVYVYENGGITADSLFEDNIETDRFVIPVNLYSATNTIRENSFRVNQFFNIQPKNKKVNDSTYVRRNIHAGRITHTLNWERSSQKYNDGDPTAGFYDNIFIDSVATLDSVYQLNISNKFMWSNLGYLDSTEKKPFYVFGAIRHDYHELSGYADKKYINQFIPSAGIYWFIDTTYLIRGRAELVTGDYNGGDYVFEGRFAYYPGKEKIHGNIEFSYYQAKQKPGWFYQQYSSNHFRWDNNFKSSNITQFSLYYNSLRIKAGLEYILLGNYVALDENALPHQSSDEISVIKANVFKDFRFGIVGIDTKFCYQQASDETFIALPDFQANIAAFVTLPLFQGATTIQPGIEVYYNTSYYANAYMPALRSFYAQSNKEVGNFVYADFFFNFRIKRARMFLKYSHINALFGQYDYFAVPSYPLMDAGFRFGLSWKFFD